uniref:Uncharacterized protein n=1 Tax=Trichogramma kaykai TaxID=54128 RepID=A0ABD2WS47_9HYME
MYKKSKSDVIVTLRDENEATRLTKDTNLTSSKLKIFNPTTKLPVKKGIIRGVDTQIDDQTIRNDLEFSERFKLIEMKRLDMRNRNSTDENKWILSRSLLLTFEGQEIPREVFIAKVKFIVEPYVSNPMQCHKRFIFGHKAKICRNKAKCYKCSADEHEGECETSSFKCVNCPEEKNDHKSTDKRCEVYRKQAEVNALDAYDNITYTEARIQVFGYPVAPQKTKDHFPALRQKAQQKVGGTNTSYATIVSTNVDSTKSTEPINLVNMNILNKVTRSPNKIKKYSQNKTKLISGTSVKSDNTGQNLQLLPVNNNLSSEVNSTINNASERKQDAKSNNQKHELKYTNLNKLNAYDLKQASASS